MNQIYFAAGFVALTSALAGCAITSYSVEPASAWKQPIGGLQKDNTLHYSANEFDGYGAGDGYQGLKDALNNNRIFTTLAQDRSHLAEPMPDHGIYVRVITAEIAPSALASSWAYAALAFGFILPAYSDEGGYTVTYKVHVDGVPIRDYRYRIYQTWFIWLPLVPFTWINALTTDEYDAFQAITRQFFSDAISDGAFDRPDQSTPFPPGYQHTPSRPVPVAPPTAYPVLSRDKSGPGLQQACYDGDATTCFTLGVKYQEGSDVPANLATAKHFFEIACGLGNQVACDFAGRIE